jgi:16S rRNA (adenine1518-N6/adenine1519-N6)-dimethyltransferase
VKHGDVVLEIGPGKGALTGQLLACGCKLIAVEKDKELFEFLKIKFEKEIAEKKLILLNEDILKFQVSNFQFPKYKIIANIPYNITGAILKKFLAAEHPSGVALRASQPECMVLMVQHEVAKRIVASDKKESILSISVKAYGEPKMIMKVDKRYFSPAPKVNSAIISIKNISRKLFEKNNTSPETPSAYGASPLAGREKFEEKFWEIVKAGFAHKRKKLSSNLKGVISPEKLSLINLKNNRAEDLTLSDWINLAKS